MKSQNNLIIVLIVLYFVLLFGCTEKTSESNHTNQLSVQTNALPFRESSIPQDIVKVTPSADINPPKSYSSEWSDPVPLPAPINTAGAEDSPFITPDGSTFYLFFTPDVRVPVEKQILDNVTGIYVSYKASDGNWSRPERVLLQEPGKLALDGCEFVLNDTMWFCSAREGYTGINWFTAEYTNNKWQNIHEANFIPSYKVGELHITSDGNELYFHSDRAGGKGGLDLWVSKKVNGVWQEPQNTELDAVNTNRSEGWPFISEDGNELWLSRDYGLWRSKKINGIWATPELIISPLAGEASLDNNGNLYFTHHFYKNNTMIEADIYIAKRKS